MAAERGKAVLGHGARLGDKYFCPSRVDALAVLDLPKVLQEPAVLRAGASAPSPHLFPPSDGVGTSEMTLNYGGAQMEMQMELQQRFLPLGQQQLVLRHVHWLYITWATGNYYWVLLHGQVILWKLLHGHRHLASCFLLLCVA